METIDQNTPTLKKPWHKRPWIILLFAFLTILLIFFIASVFYIFDQAKTFSRARQQITAGTRYEKTEGEGNYWFGSAKPKLTIVEFADFTCRYSKESYPIFKEIRTKFNRDIRIIYRDFPFTAEESLPLALAARCAGEQGLFWPMHDKLFENQGKVSKQEEMVALASQIGADSAKFSSCVASQKYLPQIKKNIDDAEKFGIQGTPTWFFNGYKVEGSMPKEVMQKIVDEFIK